MRRSITHAVAGAVLIMASTVARSDVGWSISAGATQTDNATRVETNEVDDTLATVGAALALSHESRRVAAEFSGRGTYLDYLDDSYDDDFLGSADASLVFGIIPERFLWTFEDTFGQITINQFQPVTPDNRQNANLFSTGPDFIFRFGSQTELLVTGRYSDSQFEDSEQADERRTAGGLRLLRRVSQQSSWGIAGLAQRVEYDLPGDPGYDQQEIFLTVEGEGARQTLKLDVGATRVSGDSGDDETNPLVRLSWMRRLTPSWTLDLDLGSEYQNTTDRFAAGVDQPGAGTGGVNVSNIPAETTYGALAFTFERPRTTFSFGGGASREEYVQTGEFDQDAWFIAAGASRRLRERLTGYLDYRHEEREFQSSIGSDETETFSARLDWRFGKAMYATLGYRYEDRQSDVVFGTYTENLISLTFSYRYGTLSESEGFAF